MKVIKFFEPFKNLFVNPIGNIQSVNFRFPLGTYRSGTVPTPLVVGLGEACRLAKAEMDYDHAYISRLSNKLKDMINSELESVVYNGDPDHTYPGTTPAIVSFNDLCIHNKNQNILSNLINSDQGASI